MSLERSEFGVLLGGGGERWEDVLYQVSLERSEFGVLLGRGGEMGGCPLLSVS